MTLGETGMSRETCNKCQGSGVIGAIQEECNTCQGKGWITKGGFRNE